MERLFKNVHFMLKSQLFDVKKVWIRPVWCNIYLEYGENMVRAKRGLMLNGPLFGKRGLMFGGPLFGQNRFVKRGLNEGKFPCIWINQLFISISYFIYMCYSCPPTRGLNYKCDLYFWIFLSFNRFLIPLGIYHERSS